MNTVSAVALLGLSAGTVFVVGMSDIHPVESRCQDVRQGSIIEVVNCPQTPVPKEAAERRADERQMSALLR